MGAPECSDHIWPEASCLRHICKIPLEKTSLLHECKGMSKACQRLHRSPQHIDKVVPHCICLYFTTCTWWNLNYLSCSFKLCNWGTAEILFPYWQAVSDSAAAYSKHVRSIIFPCRWVTDLASFYKTHARNDNTWWWALPRCLWTCHQPANDSSRPNVSHICSSRTFGKNWTVPITLWRRHLDQLNWSR